VAGVLLSGGGWDAPLPGVDEPANPDRQRDVEDDDGGDDHGDADHADHSMTPQVRHWM
jgi:hypothetical protein